MSLDIQYKLRANNFYLRYIREHSYWYKNLNRNPNLFKTFEEEVKETYKLRPVDKITRALNTVELLGTVISTLKG